MRTAWCALWLVGCHAAPPRTAPPRAVLVTRREASLPVVLGEFGDYCVLLRGSAFCGDLRLAEPLAKGPPLGGFTDVTQIALGLGFRCLVRATGAVHCSGDNDYGQLGAGVPAQRSNEWPAVTGLTDVRAVVAGRQVACAVDAKRRVWCWGQNNYGQTGSHVAHADTAREFVQPTLVALPGPARSVHLEYASTCALLESGAVTCWGALVESATSSRKPHEEKPAGTYERLVSGDFGTCGVGRAGAVVCFGGFDFLNPDDLDRLPGFPPVRRLAVSPSQLCAVATDGGVWCVGRSEGGAVFVPTRMVGIPPAVDVALGNVDTCVLTVAGEIWCWGAQVEAGLSQPFPPTRVALE